MTANRPEPTLSRGDLWHGVWTERDHDRADWNGFEACFASTADYESWTGEIAAMICRELALGPSDVVADLGCGTGRIAALVARRVRAVVALDYSETVLDVARHRRPCPNITYGQADLNRLDPGTLAVTKAYAVGSLFYLDSEEVVRQLIGGFHRRGVGFAAMDLPDECIGDDERRAYDRQVFTHLQFGPHRLLEAFPTGRVLRLDFPGYVHARRRFSFVLPAEGPAPTA
jgi:SAM-dependent methyltransferase